MTAGTIKKPTKMKNKKVNINIQIPDELHKKLKLEAVKKELTLKKLLLDIMEKSENKK